MAMDKKKPTQKAKNKARPQKTPLSKVKNTQRKTAAKNVSPIAKPSRRLAAKLFLIIVCSALIFGLCWGGHHYFFRENKTFTLEKIVVEGAIAATTEGDVIALLKQLDPKIECGKSNLFRIDVKQVMECVRENKSLRDVQVQRLIPDTLKIRIHERQPILKLRLRPMLLLDAEGVVLKEWVGTEIDTLPTVVAIRDTKKLKVGEPTKDKLLLGALEFLSLKHKYKDYLKFEIDTIQLSYQLNPALHVRVGESGTFRQNAEIVLPVEEMESAISRLLPIIKNREELGLPTAFVDLTYKKRIPVREE